MTIPYIYHYTEMFVRLSSRRQCVYQCRRPRVTTSPCPSLTMSLTLTGRRKRLKPGFHSNASACVGKQPIMVATASTEHSYWLALAYSDWYVCMCLCVVAVCVDVINDVCLWRWPTSSRHFYFYSSSRLMRNISTHNSTTVCLSVCLSTSVCVCMDDSFAPCTRS